MSKKALETGNSFHRGPNWDPGGSSFTRTFERQMKEGSGNGASCIKLIWAPFLWIQIMLGALVWGQSGASVKDQGSHNLTSEYVAQRACFKASVHWDGEG